MKQLETTFVLTLKQKRVTDVSLLLKFKFTYK